MAQKIKLNFEIDGLKDANKQLEKLESTAVDLKKQLDGVEEGSDAFNKINKELSETNKQMGLLKEATGQVNLDEKFEDVHSASEPLSTQLGTLTDRMYALAAAGGANTEGFKKLQEEAVNIRQTIIQVDQSIDDMAANKGLSTFGDQVTQLGASLIKLDFDRAAKQGQGLANSIKGLDFGKAIKGVKNLGSVFINLGKALLMNPIFLIAAAIAAIVAGIILLMKKLGILKPIMDAIGKVFGWIGDAIDAVVDSFKALTDWLGFTSHAAEEEAQKVADAAAKKAKATKEANESIIQGIDNEIRMMELNGIETEKQLKKKQDLEKKKAKAIKDTAQTAAAAAKAELEAAKKKGELDEAEMQALRDKVRETQLSYQQTVADLKFANAQASKELDDFRKKQKEEQDAADKEAEQKRKERAAKYKQHLADRLAAERQQEDLKLELMNEGLEKELELNRVKFERMREDTMSATNLTQTEKLALVEYYNQLEVQKNKELNDKKAADDKAAADKKAATEAAELKKQQDLEDQQFELLQSLRNTQEEQEIADLVAHYEAKFALAVGNDELEKALKEKQGEELAAINKKWRDKEAADDEAAEKEKLEGRKKIANAAIDVTSQTLSAIGAVTEAFAGKSKAAQKKAFKIQKGVQIAQATIDTYKAATGAFSSFASIPIVGTVLGAVAAAAAVALGIANIKKIADTKFEGGGSTPSASTPSVSTPSAAGGAAPTPPSINLFGSANAGSQGIGQQEAGLRQQPVVKAVVVESDITNTQNRLDTYQQRSEIG